MPFVTLVSLVLLGGVVGLLCFNTQMQQASFAATSLEAQSDNLAAREQTLHDELQNLRDPQNLAAAGRRRPGWSWPQSSCTVRLAAQTTDAGLRAGHRATTPRRSWPRAAEEAARCSTPTPIVVTVPPPPAAGTGRRPPRHHGGRGGQQGQRDTARG